MSEQAGDDFVRYLLGKACPVCGQTLGHKGWCSNINVYAKEEQVKAHHVLTNLDAVRSIGEECHRIAFSHGFWPPEGRNKGEMMMLEVTEIAERLEAVRAVSKDIRIPNIMSSKISRFTAEEEEWADLIIRALDYAVGHGLDMAALFAKMTYNEGRPHLHGKKF